MIIICLAVNVNLFSFPPQKEQLSGLPVPTLQGIGSFYLPNTLTREYERIVLDPTKYTLLAFSSVGCPPCIRAIPMLKQISEAAKGRMNVVYIALVSPRFIDDWNALLERENIEWRSLWLRDSGLAYRWRVRFVPDYILVAPNGNGRAIRLFYQENAQELFSIIGVTPIRVSAPADMSERER